MKQVYREWVEAYVARQPCGFVRGKCAEATTEMVEAFPELRRVAGFVYVDWGRDQHWWCVAPDGEIVDPTEAQFRGTIERYEELDLNDPATRARVPTGVCANCGEDAYNGDTVCSLACQISYCDYLNSNRY